MGEARLGRVKNQMILQNVKSSNSEYLNPNRTVSVQIYTCRKQFLTVFGNTNFSQMMPRLQ